MFLSREKTRPQRSKLGHRSSIDSLRYRVMVDERVNFKLHLKYTAYNMGAPIARMLPNKDDQRRSFTPYLEDG